jgi:hypothetical protein
VKIVESYLNIIIVRKGQGARSGIAESLGWSNWRLQYQPRQVCQSGQVHKIRKQILSTCAIAGEVYKKLRKISPKDMLEIRE